MYNRDKILVNKDMIEKVETKLEILKILVEDKSVQEKLSEIIEIINDELVVKDTSLQDKIHAKMIETKYSDPELNFKLYMLHRKLIDKKITIEEASKIYELYTF